MGIEKVLPEWRDLEVMLQLLPRSSTAERMNPYTSLWTRRARAATAREEFHLVLLDGGPHGRARGRGRPPGAALHPLLGVPERLPGLLARRRARLRVGLSRARSARSSRRSCRGSTRRRRCRGRRRCAAPATTPARSRSTSRPCSCTCAGGSCARRSRASRPSGWRWTPSAASFRSRRATSARSGSRRRGRGPLRQRGCRAGRRCASCPRCRSARSASGGRAEREAA